MVHNSREYCNGCGSGKGAKVVRTATPVKRPSAPLAPFIKPRPPQKGWR